MQHQAMLVIRSAVVLVLLLMLAACGGGGGGTALPVPAPTPAPSPAPAPTPAPTPVQQTTAVLKLQAYGASSVALSGAGVTVVLPVGVTPKLNSSGEVDSSVIQVSGAAVPGASISAYIPATATEKGKLTLAVASSLTTGFKGGEYATVTLQIAQGATVIQSNFSLTGFAAISASGDTVADYIPSFLATIQ